jgi:hypothetical protein
MPKGYHQNPLVSLYYANISKTKQIDDTGQNINQRFTAYSAVLHTWQKSMVKGMEDGEALILGLKDEHFKFTMGSYSQSGINSEILT